MKQEDLDFLRYVEHYVTHTPEIAAHIAGFVAEGIEKNRREQIAKSADMEIIISFLMRGGKLKPSDKKFVSDKMEKWNHVCSLNWASLIEQFKDA